MSDYLVQFNNISKFFGKVIALKDVTMKLKKGEIMCLLGDNGAGKSTLIKTLAGVHRPDEGEIIVEGKKTIFDSPKDALDMGIATVYQDLALVSLMSVTRNFFMGREPMKGPPFFKTFDIEKANKIAAERMGQIGIDVRDPSQAVGTMSGGERQCLAISRAIYFGAKVLVLDEPTSALGVHQASVVLKYIVKAASQGLAVILITHNVHHAYPVGNSFTVLNRGKSLGTYEKKNISREKLLSMMAGGEELNKLEVELQEMVWANKLAKANRSAYEMLSQARRSLLRKDQPEDPLDDFLGKMGLGDPDPSNYKKSFDGADEIVEWFRQDKTDDWLQHD